jgi:hypothetical protein
MNRPRLLLYFLLLYLSVGLYFSNCLLAMVNEDTSGALTVLIASIKLEHETFKACESGNLVEYRIKKIQELFSK